LVHPSGDRDQHEPERIQNSWHLVSSLSRAFVAGDKPARIQGDPISRPQWMLSTGITGHVEGTTVG
jgi:hypothetical protein